MENNQPDPLITVLLAFGLVATTLVVFVLIYALVAAWRRR